MLDKIKLSIRIFHNVIDNDIKFNIDSCMRDLQRVGVAPEKADLYSDDPLIAKAAELYCKWQYDFGGKGDQYKKAYEGLRDALSVCGDYNGGDGVV